MLLINLPKKVIEDKSPLSLVLICKSHCAAGIIKDTPIVSFNTVISKKLTMRSM